MLKQNYFITFVQDFFIINPLLTSAHLWALTSNKWNRSRKQSYADYIPARVWTLRKREHTVFARLPFPLYSAFVLLPYKIFPKLRKFDLEKGEEKSISAVQKPGKYDILPETNTKTNDFFFVRFFLQMNTIYARMGTLIYDLMILFMNDSRCWLRIFV